MCLKLNQFNKWRSTSVGEFVVCNKRLLFTKNKQFDSKGNIVHFSVLLGCGIYKNLILISNETNESLMFHDP